MCSTPRSSAKVRGTRRLATSKTSFRSYSQMMQQASLQYEQRQEEREKRQQLLLNNSN